MNRTVPVVAALICTLAATASVASATDYVFTWRHNIPNTNPAMNPPPLSCSILKIETRAENGYILQYPSTSAVFNKIGDTAKLTVTANGCATVSAYARCYYGNSEVRAEAHSLPCTSSTININSLNNISKQ